MTEPTNEELRQQWRDRWASRDRYAVELMKAANERAGRVRFDDLDAIADDLVETRDEILSFVRYQRHVATIATGGALVEVLEAADGRELFVTDMGEKRLCLPVWPEV